MDSHSPRKKSLGLDVPRTAIDSPPGIAALFVIHFDIKAGYMVTWKRTIPGVEIEGAVEYKSLPSGLHNVSEDLVYFVHEQYAGISAFVKQDAGESERNAKMFTIGVLVPLSSGRLGKSWRHAPNLKELAQRYSELTFDPHRLTEYWERYELSANEISGVPPDSPLESPLSLRLRAHGDRSDHRRSRALSDAIVLETPRPALTPFHPASSLPDFLTHFGPLLFPLYRAALLRKRVLFMAEAPVQIPCNYVYDLSLLASLPNSLLPLLPSDLLPSLRPRALFNVGVYDIPFLSSLVGARAGTESDCAWIACSTDSVLSMKPELFDILVTLPPNHSKNAAEKAYPTITISSPALHGNKSPQKVELKATQRDVRRYTALRQGLRRAFKDDDSLYKNNISDDNSDTASTFSSSPIVEPLSWARLAYTSFIWWASAGEKRDGFSEEEEEEHEIEQDARLLASVENLPSPPSGSTRRRSMQLGEPLKQPPEIALVAYFRQLTTQIFATLSDVIARQDDQNNAASNDSILTPYQDEDSDEDDNLAEHATLTRDTTQEDETTSPLLAEDRQTSAQDGASESDCVAISAEDMAEMGLDTWSAADRIFVEELVFLWWKRKAHVDSARIRCCGISLI
ncbi:hypothetical protein BJX63DRAFT_419266 [Aspergillus granulosus]|uniref:DUF4484 domain-containing protein n=1 Tax=Aspergillus granulosus TaxID=176169 RepID=A0ABR4HS59_9EURO